MRRRWQNTLVMMVSFCIVSFGFSAKTVTVIMVDTPPNIDGVVDETVWQKAVKIDEFYQREPDTGQPVSEKTEAYICYDLDYLYFGVHCYDDPKRITAKELERDATLKFEDHFVILLDTFRDNRNGYFFELSPRGSKGDALVSQNGASFNKQWDGLWKGKANIHADGWDAEFAIPFKTLTFRSGETTWGLKMMRNIERNLENAYWPSANLDAYRTQLSDAGTLEGLHGITQGKGLDIRPYVQSSIDQEVDEQTEVPFDVGIDAFYQITPALKTVLSINTDFAQTEVDA